MPAERYNTYKCHSRDVVCIYIFIHIYFINRRVASIQPQCYLIKGDIEVNKRENMWALQMVTPDLSPKAGQKFIPLANIKQKKTFFILSIVISKRG